MSYVGSPAGPTGPKKIASKSESGDGSEMYKQMKPGVGPGKGDKDGSKDRGMKSGFSSDCPALKISGPRAKGGK